MSRLVLVLALLACSSALAHPLSPAALELEERDELRYRLGFRRSAQLARDLTLQLPADCRMQAPVERVEGESLVTCAELTCARTLTGRSIGVLGLAELSLGAIVHVRLRDGRSVQALLGPDQPSVVMPERAQPLDVFGQYLWLGISHLLTGADHVLFVLGLLWLVRGLGRVLLTLTAFTLGHSVTLCLAALELVRVPGPPVEVGIALSLVLLAHQLLARESGSERTPALVVAVGGLGLLHGLGFAGALAETGLPSEAIPLSLAAFNLGVELGQVMVVLALAPLLWLVGRLGERPRQRLRFAVAYGIGTLAAMWVIERTLVVAAG
jgi:hydrogenase/urease accessory protein HupE